MTIRAERGGLRQDRLALRHVSAAQAIFGYEVDGLDYTFAAVCPFPQGRDGAPVTVQLLCVTLTIDTEAVRYRPAIRR
jgi:hypothetical protein